MDRDISVPPSHSHRTSSHEPHTQVPSSAWLPASWHTPLIPEMLRADQKKKASVSQVSLSKKVFFSLKISLQLLLYPLHPQSGDGRYSSDSSLVIPQSPLRKDISLFGWPPPGSMMPAESVEHTQASVHASRPCLHLLDQPRL